MKHKHSLVKIEAGRYMYGQTYIVRHKPIPGRQQTTTWKNALTGKWLGYTLSEAIATLDRVGATIEASA